VKILKMVIADLKLFPPVIVNITRIMILAAQRQVVSKEYFINEMVLAEKILEVSW
jgi:hypothetical protein